MVYQIQCEACGPSAAYVGKTINTLHERFYGPNGHLHLSTNGSALLEHLAQEISPNCEFNSDNIKILDSCSNDFFIKRVINKSLQCHLKLKNISEPLNLVNF